MKITRFLSLSLFICLTQASFAQRKEIDSLRQVYARVQTETPSQKRDTTNLPVISQLYYYYALSNDDSALYFAKLKLNIGEKYHLENVIGNAYNGLGYLYMARGNHFVAADYYYKALQLAEKQQNAFNIIQSARLLASAYFSLNDFDKALIFSKKGADLANTEIERLAKTDKLTAAYMKQEGAACLSVLGGVYLNKNQWGKAEKAFQEMATLSVAIKDYEQYSEALRLTGNTKFQQKKYADAEAYYQQVLTIAQLPPNTKAATLIDGAALRYAQKQYLPSLKLLSEATTLATSLQALDLLVKIKQLMYQNYKALNQPTDALKAQEQYLVLKDSLMKEDVQRRVNSLQLEYDNQQKNSQLQAQQIQMLSDKNENQQLTQTRNLLLLGALGIALLAGILIWNNRRLQHKNEQIEIQKTEINQAKEALSQINQTLEQRVEIRTKELLEANQELIQKNEEIKTALFTGQSIERKRVASELHDNLSSLLSAVNMSMQTINASQMSEKEQKVYQNIREMVKNAYHEVRNISHNIMPSDLEKNGLWKSIYQLIEKVNLNQPLQFSLTTHGFDERLPISLELNVYSITLELMNNIIKHAQATKAQIVMTKNSDVFLLYVTDNGVGIDAEKGQNGNGLQNIKARLEALNGDLMMSSLPNKTSFQITIPIG